MEWGKGRIEIVALRDEILSRLQQGHTVRQVFRDLTDAGRINAKQSTFYKHVSALRAEAVGRPARFSVGSKRAGNQSDKPKGELTPGAENGAGLLVRVPHEDAGAAKTDELWFGDDEKDGGE